MGLSDDMRRRRSSSSVSGPPEGELIRNGTFSSNVDGWDEITNYDNGTFSSGTMSVDVDAALQGASQVITGFDIGIIYEFTFDIVSADVSGRINIGSTTAPHIGAVFNETGLTPGSYTRSFTAASTSHGINLTSNGTLENIVYDSISIKILP